MFRSRAASGEKYSATRQFSSGNESPKTAAPCGAPALLSSSETSLMNRSCSPAWICSRVKMILYQLITVRITQIDAKEGVHSPARCAGSESRLSGENAGCHSVGRNSGRVLPGGAVVSSSRSGYGFSGNEGLSVWSCLHGVDLREHRRGSRARRMGLSPGASSSPATEREEGAGSRVGVHEIPEEARWTARYRRDRARPKEKIGRAAARLKLSADCQRDCQGPLLSKIIADRRFHWT